MRSPAEHSRAIPFLALGVACIVAGGLVAAVTASQPSEPASWAAAYLVLVAGLAQVGLGLGRVWLATSAVRRRSVVCECACWNVANAAVLAGTLLAVVPLTDAGGALLVVALLLMLRGTTRKGRTGTTPAIHNPSRSLVRYGFWLVALVIAVSVPIGLVLARV